MKLGIVIGRFQPVHWGHLDLIDKARKDNDSTLVILGSVNRLPDFKNPLTPDERQGLLEKLLYAGDDCVIQRQNDRPTDDEWVQDIVARVNNIEEDPTQVTLYCAKKDEEFYRSNFIYNVETVDTRSISATDVRHAWYHKSLWTVEDDVPQATLDLLNEFPDFEIYRKEWETGREMAFKKKEGHPFGNPLEPVSFAVIVQDNKILTGFRGGDRGYGTPGLPGGYVENTESTLQACMRETKEEMGIDLEMLIITGQAVCMAQAVEENLDDIGTRTIGINYLFVIKPEVDLEITVDGEETLDYQWIPLRDILEEKTLLFYNHNLVTQRLLARVGEST